MTTEELEVFAADLIKKLSLVIDSKNKELEKYQGAIEGVKLFMQELKARPEKQEAE